MLEAFAPQGRWSRGIATYLIYVAAGAVSLGLSTPSDTISLLYMAAGFGLACVLCWGRVNAVAVGLGSLTVGVFGVLAGAGLPQHWGGWLGLVASGVGGGLQVWAAARWVQGPDENAPLPLDNLRDITRFMLLAGPLACVINPVLTSTALVLSGATPYTEWLPLMASWWAGDTLGVLMGTPLLLTLLGRPARLWHQRRYVVGLPLLASAILLGLGIRQIQDWDQEREDSAFRLHAEATTNAMRLRLNAYLAALESMRAIYDASDSVERDEFRRASTSWLKQLPGTQALGWTERLDIGRLDVFQTVQRSEGAADYHVFDQPGRTAPKGPDLAAIRFIEPLEGNETAMGLNVLSVPLARQTFQQAVLSNQPAASPGLRLTQEKGSQLGVVIYRAVYRSPNVLASDRSTTAMGVVFLALRVDDALVAVLKDMPPFMQACLLDRSEPGGEPHFLGGTPGCGQDAKAAPAHAVTVPLSFAQREWSLRLWSVGPVPSVGGRATAWLFAIGGVGFAAALGTLLLMVTGHAERMTAAIDDARLQRAAAESANQAKSDFLSRMSHELRTPLNAILGFAQVMGLDRNPPLGDAQRHRLEQIQQAGWHLLDMIDDVLDLSRIDTGTLKLLSERLPLPPLLEATRQLVADLARRNEVTLTIDGTLPAGWGVQADETRLKQILTNLLSNAVKYNQAGGSVHVQAALLRGRGNEPSMVNIVVTDTGLGMSEQQLAQLFQPFNRLGREKNTPDGTGIGLVISRHLAQLMGGQLEATSREGAGSTFTLTLPAATLASEPPAPPPRPEPALATPPGTAQDMRHVLYVEDNDANTAVVQAALSSRPWIKLTVAATIEAGLAALHDRLRGPLPQLILLDVHLPDASGLDFLKLAKANPETQHIPVVMISADALPEQIDNALKAGAAAYLTKPLQIAALLDMVDDMLASAASSASARAIGPG
ncbi:MAG TPA: CHASE domain-containing protein [Candidatus Aquabacterium excrementipullorum]|nr:CHASE domain-containing protein [Candidatus Aquabacterium excrementipullorum]